jgi:hypothetical protein
LDTANHTFKPGLDDQIVVAIILVMHFSGNLVVVVIVQPKNGRAKNRWSSNPVLNIIANFLT